ncbi:prolyl hydroxylase family protein [Maricaulis sp. CAU 1757]
MSETPSSIAPVLGSALEHWRSGRSEAALTELESALLAGEFQLAAPLINLAGRPDAPADALSRSRAILGRLPDHPGLSRHIAYLDLITGRACLEEILSNRMDAVKTGDSQAALELGLLSLMTGSVASARPWLDQAAKLGSGHAIAAKLRLCAEAGQIDPSTRDSAAALVASGHPLAGHLRSVTQALPLGDPDTTAPLQAAELARRLTEPDLIAQALSTDPRIIAFETAVPRAVCDYLAAGTAQLLRPAEIFDPASGQTRPDPYRTSLTASLGEDAMDLVLWAIKHRLARLAGSELARAEAMAVLAYRPGDEYRRHFDFLIADGAAASADLEARGQRRHTVLLRLNDEFEGGATYFPRLDIRWQDRAGGALAFDNLDQNGDGNPLTLHAGEPVASGTKLLASLWLRER